MLEDSVIRNSEELWRLVNPPRYVVRGDLSRIIDLIGSGSDADRIIRWLQPQTSAPTTEAVRAFFREWHEESSATE